jgi:hypothetical protein
MGVAATLAEAGAPVYETCEFSAQVLPSAEALGPDALLVAVRWWDQRSWTYGPVKELLVRTSDTVQVGVCCGSDMIEFMRDRLGTVALAYSSRALLCTYVPTYLRFCRTSV